MFNYSIKYAYWIIFRDKVTDTVRKKENRSDGTIYMLPLIIKRIAIFLYLYFKREDSSDCGGVSTRGHG